ncbi:restriction endonuclease subunit S [Aquabacterium sp.]|uniref:restriction endonuclease subunit S n=1 Tax=Aquabacterium sp. TaxID=1872578 RepID=UPI002488DEEF|nr:restriction endonuclease subunit S [Aquabacterium sp.]MDI1260506.1 restriction endonuclease subunit S [Aquabacterium sp.]
MTEWPIATIGGVCRVYSGGTPSKGNAAYWRGSIPWVSAKDLKADRIFDAELCISQRACEETAAKIAPSGSLLVLVRGMGLANGIQIGEVTSPVAFNQDLRAIVPPATVDSRFLLLALRHGLADGGNSVLSSAAHGTLKIDANALRQIEFPVPPLGEQHRIVAILDEAFEGIATAKANAEKNLQNARELGESLIEQCFENHVDQSFLPRELAQLCEFIVDCEHKTAPTQGEGFPSIRTPNIGRGKLILDDVNRVSHETYVSWTRRAVPRPGDLILAREAPAGNVAVIPEGVQACLGQRTVLLRPKRDVFHPEYLAHLLLQRSSQTRLLAHSRGATVQHVNMKDIRAFEIHGVPPLERQLQVIDALAAVEVACEKLLESQRKKIAALDELKKSLLHQAFTGQL